MKVVKRNGAVVPFDMTQIRKETIPAVKGLDRCMSYEELELKASVSITSGMTTEDVQQVLIKVPFNHVDVDTPNNAIVAGRLLMFDLYHRVKRNYFDTKVDGDVYKAVPFSMYLETNSDGLSYDIKLFDFKKLDDAIVGINDMNFTYVAVDALMVRYLGKHYKGKELMYFELPQHMLMSLACFLAQKEEDPTYWALTFYERMTKRKFWPATPTLANGRFLRGNCFSCAVGSTPDSIEGIFDGYKTKAIGSKYGSGWGWDWTRVRANSGAIDGLLNIAGGTIPFLKMENDLAIAVDQLKTRLGAINVTMETWHKDILDFLKLKKNGGDERRTAKELFITASCSDVFMERVENNEEFTLFCPYDTPDLPETFGDDFRAKYLAYEHRFKVNPNSFTNTPIVVNAKKDIWKPLQTLAYEVGMPNVFFKDTANAGLMDDIKEEYQEGLGLIRCPNLCMEFLNPIKDTEVPLCNLGSINLANVGDDKDLEHTTRVAMRMLDNVTDVTMYRIPNSEDTQKLRRSVGLGICGEAEAIANSRIMYGSEEHLEWIDDMYGRIAKYRDDESINLGKEKGACPLSKRGYRNLYRGAIAPTSSIAILLGTSPCHEAVFDKVWAEENHMGVYNITAPNINPDNFSYYVSIYDVDQLDAVKATARRQKHFDMGISHNIYVRPETVTGKQVYDIYMLMWKLKCKTTYYLRSRSKKLKEVVDNSVACVGCAS